MRQLFATILTHCEPHDPRNLWETFKHILIEDYLHQNMPVITAEQSALSYINNIIKQSGRCLSDFNLPEVLNNIQQPDDIEDFPAMAAEAAQMRETLILSNLKLLMQ